MLFRKSMSDEFKPEVIDFPTEDYPRFDGKVIQLYLANNPREEPDIPILVFGNGIHGKVLERFLNSKGLEYELSEGAFTGKMLPKIEGPQYKVVGMANVRVFPSDEMIMIMSGSRDYPTLETNRNHLDEIIGYGLIPEPWQVMG